jgi:hypothetical protein
MKRKVFLGISLLGGSSSPVLASAGYAYDGLDFILVLAGLMLVLAAILWGIDYLGKNGRALGRLLRIRVWKVYRHLKETYRHRRTNILAGPAAAEAVV